MSAVRTSGLTKVYGRVRALDGLDLEVAEGTVFGFLGPNGAGKTTAIRVLTGLAPATAGQAWVAGTEVTAPGQSVARQIGHLPEEPAFYNWMTPAEFLDHVGRVFGLGGAERQARVKDLLAQVGLSEVARRRIGGFSRGMRQRLGLAQALINRPPVLFLDEPVSALDPVGRKEVLALIEGLRGQCTVFMSTHILEDVERVCDTVGILARGRLVTQAPRPALLEQYAVPAFEIEAAPAHEAALAAWAETLRREPWVASIRVERQVARVNVCDGAESLAQAQSGLLASAVAAGLVLRRYEMLRPSLEDVFLRLVREAP